MADEVMTDEMAEHVYRTKKEASHGGPENWLPTDHPAFPTKAKPEVVESPQAVFPVDKKSKKDE